MEFYQTENENKLEYFRFYELMRSESGLRQLWDIHENFNEILRVESSQTLPAKMVNKRKKLTNQTYAMSGVAVRGNFA